ncbi:epoxyqueuosine reductase [Intestinibacter sp.]|uniref:epoxyqueuosine reductase n=1 Tax=Intestinibacter sp. TaxID=1965304 RepID=UPI003F177BEF
MDLGTQIRNKALELGYENCGIIKIDEMNGYADKIYERIDRFPETKECNESFLKFANIKQNFPWAKSIIICSYRHGKYKIPEHLKGLIAKYYLVDNRNGKDSDAYKSSIAFENYLHEIGIKAESEILDGITALRWAAFKAGLGIIRKNNFFYSNSGSWVNLEAWIIDKELELKPNVKIKECPPNCNLCMKACPTKALAEPYMTNRLTCVSYLTTLKDLDMPNEKYKKEIGSWVYGCDICQDVCPFNKDKWTEDEDFPGLEELGEHISLEKIIEMDYDFLRDVMNPKFWYMSKDDMWKWKVNALNARECKIKCVSRK